MKEFYCIFLSLLISQYFAQSCTTLFNFDDGSTQGWQIGDSSYSSFATAVGVAQSHSTSGSYALQMSFNNMGGKTYAAYLVENGAGNGWSLSGNQFMEFDLNLSETDLVTGVSIALSTGSGWAWQQTTQITSLSPGSNPLSFPIGSITQLDQVHRIAILLFANSGSGQVFVDSVKFCSSSSTPTAAPAPVAAPTPVTTTPQSPVPTSCSEFVTASGTKFAVDGCWFYVSGTNNYYLSYQKDPALDDFMTSMSGLGMNVLRTWGFIDGGSKDGTTRYNIDPPGPKNNVIFQYWDNGVVQNTGVNGLNNFDKVLAAAAEKGIKVIIPLVNNWKNFGGMDQYGVWFQVNPNYHDQFYTNPAVKQAYKNYISVLVNRVNTVNQRKYSEDPTIFAWELANEPRCKGTDWGSSATCNTHTLTDWVSEMSAYIKSLDSNHMVAVGDEGFFNRSGSDWTYNGSEGVDFEAFLRLPTVDFGTLHLYPEDWGKPNEAWATQYIADHIAAAKAIGKPVILEEYGIKDQSQRNRIYQNWLDVVYNNDGAGDLVWMLAADVDGSPYPDYDLFTIYDTSPAISVISPHIARMKQKNTCFECTPLGITPTTRAPSTSAFPSTQAGVPMAGTSAWQYGSLKITLFLIVFSLIVLI